MKPKAKTLQERFGFKDDDLAQSKHDEIMLWLDAKIESVVAGLFPQEWTEAEISAQQKRVTNARTVWMEGIKNGCGLGPEDATRLRLLEADIKNWHVQADPDKERECQERLDAYLQSLALNWPNPGPVPFRPTCKVLSKEWERTITDRTYVIGFIDFCVEIARPTVKLDGTEEAGPAFAPSD